MPYTAVFECSHLVFVIILLLFASFVNRTYATHIAHPGCICVKDIADRNPYQIQIGICHSIIQVSEADDFANACFLHWLS